MNLYASIGHVLVYVQTKSVLLDELVMQNTALTCGIIYAIISANNIFFECVPLPVMHDKCINDLAAAQKCLHEGELKKAAVLCKQVIRLFPDQPDALNMLGVIALRRQKYRKVIEYLSKAIVIRPQEAIYHYNLAVAQLNVRQLTAAVRSLEEALRLEPGLAQAYSNLCYALNQLHEIDGAVAAGQNAVRLEPDDAKAHTNLAISLDASGSLDDALRHYQIAAELAPSNHIIRKNLGMAYMELGDKVAAERCFRAALEVNPGYGEAYRYLTALRKFSKQDDSDVVLMQQILNKPGLADDDCTELNFALGKVYDDCGFYEEAFEYYATGNRLENRRYTFNLQDFSLWIDQLQGVFSRDFMLKRENIGSQDELPVFIVGLPRSGTTLVEQILASHSDIFGAGELLWFSKLERGLKGFLGSDLDYPLCLQKLSEVGARVLINKYLTLLRGQAPDAMRVVDKMPDNFMRLGLIHLLFPKARIVHCCRDPRDTALSIYTNLFKDNIHWSYDLYKIGGYTALYQQVMQHWRDIIPDSIHEIRYEALVRNPEEVARNLLDYIGLPWDPACLAFYKTDRRVRTTSHDQVRQPIYTRSIGRWKRYEKFLTDFYEGMEEYGGVF